MSVVMQINPFDFFADTQGDPLDAGYVWIGLPDTDPRQYPVTAYYDEALTIPAAMPLRTVSGYIVRNGAPAFLYINGNYSVMVQDKNQRQLFYVPDFLLIGSGTAVTLGELANTTDPTKGVSLIPTAERLVTNIATLKTLPKIGGSLVAFVEGYYLPGDGGGGHYRLDAADVASADNGGTIIVANDGGRWKLIVQDGVSVLQFGVKADAGATDNSVRLQACRDWVASGAVRNRLYFPAGIYGYSVSPNWAIQNATITAEGEVRLRYSGTGNAVIIDLGATPSTYLFNVTMGPFHVEAPSTAQNGVYIRSIHHSKLAFKVKGAGTNFAGMLVVFAVCTDFSGSSCYPNDDGNWYLGAKPKYGLQLTNRDTGEHVSYSLFNNTIWEGLDQSLGAGILLDGALGNIFVGGTSERCHHGVITTAKAINNRFYGTDIEANLARDILENGQGQEFHGLDSDSLVTVGGSAFFPKFFGGTFNTVEIATGARWPLFQGVTVNRLGTGGFINGEPTSMFRNCFDMLTQKITPLLQGAIVVGASPFTYTNLTGNPQSVFMTTGTISAVSITRNAVNNGVDASTRQVLLAPGDAVVVTYSVLPIMYQYSH